MVAIGSTFLAKILITILVGSIVVGVAAGIMSPDEPTHSYVLFRPEPQPTSIWTTISDYAFKIAGTIIIAMCVMFFIYLIGVFIWSVWTAC
jgi:ABC-type Na+ efflux pump permease subunit